MAPDQPAQRLITLDLIRGIAVMGIFSVNVIGMAMIQAAYFTPAAYGFDNVGDKLVYAANLLLIDGKMRALFSMVFGASALLVIERAVAAGRSSARVHFSRMAALLLFGLAHYYLLWWGDILAQYALIGMVLFLFRKLGTRALLIWSLALLLWNGAPSTVMMTISLPERLAQSADHSPRPAPDVLAEDRAVHHSIATHARHMLSEKPLRPFMMALALLPETLGLMLLGMAAYRSGFFAGRWPDHRYRNVAMWGIGAGLLAGAASLVLVAQSDFAAPLTSIARNGWTVLFRPVMASGYAALAILLFRRPGWLAERIAAVGRTAFTNYLGCTVIGVALFFRFAGGLYGDLSRGQAWLIAPPVWLLMLAWSKPWLDRFHYGPLEWAWRSLSRLKFQPLRKSA